MQLPSALRRLRSMAVRAAGSAARMLWRGEGGQGYTWRVLLPGAQYDYEAAAGDLWRSSAVAACLVWLKRNFPEPRLEAVRTLADGSKEVVPNSRCVRLLDRPNAFYGRYMISAAMVLSAIVDGNIYLRKIRSGSGVPVELWWIPHWLIVPCWPQDGTQFISHYEYTVNGRVERLRVEDVVHIRIGVDPRNDRLGFSDLKTAVRSICGLNECDTYTAAILRNMGIPGVIVSPGSADVSMSEDDIAVFKDQWRERYTSEGRGDPLVGTRMFKVEKLSLTPEEMRLDKLPSRLEDQVCSVIGVPAMVVGLTSGAQHKTYANYGEARKAAYEDCLIPLQKMIAEELTMQLLGDFPEDAQELRWDYAGIQCLAESENEQAARVGDLYQKHRVIKRSEAREALGYDWDDDDEVYASEAEPPPPMPGEGDGQGQLPAPEGDEAKDEGKRSATVWRTIESVMSRIEEAQAIDARRAARRNGDGDPWSPDPDQG